MKILIKKSLSVFWRFLFANFICLFAVIMVSTLSTSLFTKEIGYTAYGVAEGKTENELLYTYYSADGEDTKKAEYEEKGYTVSTTAIRDDMSKAERNIFLVVCLIVTLWLTGSFIYGTVWAMGNKDNNRVHFGRMKEDKLHGIKIGLLATVPHFLFYIAFLICAFGAFKSFSVAIYKFVNCYAFSIVDWICGSVFKAGELSFVQLLLLLLPLIFPALVCHTAYTLGFKDISVMEKIVYKNKKKDK